MKITIRALVLLLLLTSTCLAKPPKKQAAPTPPPKTGSSEIGRYQITHGAYASVGPGGARTENVLMKLDTVTGETWILDDSQVQTTDEKTNERKHIMSRGWTKTERRIEFQIDEWRKEIPGTLKMD